MAFAKKCYDGPITAADTDAARLTMEQLSQLVTWASWQPSEYFETRPVQFALDVYHETAAWDSIQGLCEEADEDELKAFVSSFNAGLRNVCKLSGPDYDLAKLEYEPA